MPKKYLLYMDILGFSELVLKRGRVNDLYKVIDSLNLFKHQSFEAIAFSDTILVYNTRNPENAHERHYLIMYLCEFAKDMFYRLIRHDIHFRAYLVRGEFIHNELKHLDAFYGEALVRAYRHEGEIQCSGLFIENKLLPDCDIFFSTPYDEQCCFVHIMQSLDQIRFEGEGYPITSELIVPMGYEWFLAYDITYLRQIHGHMNDIALPPRIRVKYASAWQMIRTRHNTLLDSLRQINSILAA